MNEGIDYIYISGGYKKRLKHQGLIGTFRNRTTNVNVYDNDISSYVTVNNVSFGRSVNVYDNDILTDCI